MSNNPKNLPQNKHCYRVIHLISQWQDDDISTLQKGQVYSHLCLCKNCRNFKHNIQALNQIMTQFKTQDD